MSQDQATCPCSQGLARLEDMVRALRDELRQAMGTDLLTVKEAAKLMKTSPNAIYQQIRRGAIKSVHVMGTRVRIRREDLPIK